jgi:hypothetical protein
VAVDRDIRRMAEYLIARHGAAAAHVTQERIDELARKSEHRACGVWKEIAAAIEEIQKQHAGEKPRRDDNG